MTAGSVTDGPWSPPMQSTARVIDIAWLIFRDYGCKNGRTRHAHPAGFSKWNYSPLAFTTFLPRYTPDGEMWWRR